MPWRAAIVPTGFWLFVLGKLGENDVESFLHSPEGHLAAYSSAAVAENAKKMSIPTVSLPAKFFVWQEIRGQFGGKKVIVDWYPGAEGSFDLIDIPPLS